MLKIIAGIEIYSPEPLGVKDVLLIDSKIGKIADKIAIPPADFMEVEVISGEGKILTPGFIDAHVHIESSMVSPSIFAIWITTFSF
jgi:beta-aspartyl-dipeptidase (metallo-type)